MARIVLVSILLLGGSVAARSRLVVLGIAPSSPALKPIAESINEQVLTVGEPAANGHRLLGFDALLPRNSGGSTDPGNCIGLRGQPALDFLRVDYAIVIVERHGNDPTWHLGVDGGARSSNYVPLQQEAPSRFV